MLSSTGNGTRVGRAHRNALIITVGLGIAGVAGGSTTLLLGGALTMAAVLASASQLLRPKPSPILHRGVHLLTVCGLVGALAIIARARIDAVLLIVMLGIFNRFVLRSSPRDDFIIVAASAVLLTMATTVTPGIAFLPLVLFFLPSALWALTTANALAQQRWSEGRQDVAQARVPRLDAALSLGATAFMLLAFVGVSLFPRYNFGRLMAAGSFMRLSGVGSSMDMSTGGVSDSVGGTVLLRVEGPDAMSEGLYARIYAFDEFDGRAWGQSPVLGLKAFQGASGEAGPSKRVHELRLRRLVERGQPHPVAALGTRHPWGVGLRRPLHAPSGTWFTQVPQATLQLEYKVFSDRRPTLPALAEASMLRLPQDLDPRLELLATRLVGDADEPAEKVERVLAHFADGFRYSLEPVPGESEDPLARFLFEAKAGHCELYAGAVVVLLRSVGVPARVAAGYYGGWWNARSQTLEFTPDDAHAWVEWYDEGRGWTWVDATPPGTRTRRDGKSLAWLRDWYDWLEGAWYNHVVDYDETRRRALLERVEAGFEAGWSGLTGGSEADGRPGLAPWLGGALAAAFGAVALGAGLLRRRQRPESLGRRLRRRLRCGPTETLGQAVARLPRVEREAAAAAVQAYERLRFGRGGDLAEARRALRALADAGRARSGSVRRWTGPGTASAKSKR